MVLVYFAHWMGSVGLSLSGFCLQGQVLFGGGSSFHSGIEFGQSRTGEGSSGGRKRGGGVRSGSGAARTILLFHTVSASPPKQPRMVRTFLQVHTRPRLAYALRCRGY